MNETVKKLWLAALRSGIYKQGKGCLHNDKHEYCCLGVLADVYQKQTGKGEWIEHDDRFIFETEEENGSTSVLPSFVQRWAELSRDNPSVPTGISLAEHNDNGASFERIADLIEKNL